VLNARAKTPGKGKLEFFSRAAPGAQALAGERRIPVTANTVPLKSSDRCLQYRAVFVSDNGARYPELKAVEFTFN
jgi:hypothetical protein